MSQMHVWITGFGPFPGSPTNPTQALVNGLAELDPASIGAKRISAHVLPVEYDRALELVGDVRKNLNPDLSVHFGVAAAARGFRLERIARSGASSTRPDNAGRLEPECPGARPERLIPVYWPGSALRAVTACGIESELSDDAGGYVCNAVYFRSLSVAAELVSAGGRLGWTGFVHMPHSDASAPTAELEPGSFVVLPEPSTFEAARMLLSELVRWRRDVESTFP